MTKLRLFSFIFWIGIISFSCSSYKKGILFKTDETTELQEQLVSSEKSYLIREGDYLMVNVFSGNGEILVDPDGLLRREMEAGETRKEIEYRVVDGAVRLPMAGEIPVAGKTVDEANQIFQDAYNVYYDSTYVITTLTSRRFVVIGPSGGEVIPLPYENINLIEGLAMSAQLTPEINGTNIRLIRGDLKNPDIYIIDLSTTAGLTNSVVPLQPGDIIYIEPTRRITDQFREITPVLSLFTNLITLTIILINNL